MTRPYLHVVKDPHPPTPIYVGRPDRRQLWIGLGLVVVFVVGAVWGLL